MPNDKVPFENMALSLKSLEEENSTLKSKITMLELNKDEKKSAHLSEFNFSFQLVSCFIHLYVYI